MAEYPRPKSFGDDWTEFLNCAVGLFWKWLATEWQELDADVGRRGFHPRADVGARMDAAIRGLPHFVDYVLAWCYEHQEFGRPVITDDQESELVRRVDSILDGIVKKLGENVRNNYEIQKAVWRAEIPRRFQDGRRGFTRRSAKRLDAVELTLKELSLFSGVAYKTINNRGTVGRPEPTREVGGQKFFHYLELAAWFNGLFPAKAIPESADELLQWKSANRGKS